MRLFSLLCVLLLTAAAVSGQNQSDTALTPASGWRTSIDASLTTGQAAYSDSWVGGEVGSVNWAFNANLVAERAFSLRVQNKTTLKIAFGQTFSQQRDDSGNIFWERPKKSTDLLDLETVFRFTLGGYVDPYLAGRVESKFFDDSLRILKRWFSPTKFTESGGILRKFVDKPKQFELTSRLGFAFRQIMTEQIVDTSAVDNVAPIGDRDITNDGGPESVTDLLVKLRSNLTFASKLTLYKALFFSGSETAPDKDWQAVDVNWEHFLAAQLARNLATVLYVQLLYDKEVVDEFRIKETLGLGLTVKL